MDWIWLGGYSKGGADLVDSTLSMNENLAKETNTTPTLALSISTKHNTKTPDLYIHYKIYNT